LVAGRDFVSARFILLVLLFLRCWQKHVGLKIVSSSMSRSVLKIRYEYPFEVIGIVSGAKDYRLCHCINKELKMNFCRVNDLQMVMNRQGDETSFSFFKDENQEPEKFMLIGNKGSNAWFFPEIKNVDYLFVACDPGNWFDMDEMLQRLRKLEVIGGAYEITYDRLKSKENLLFLN